MTKPSQCPKCESIHIYEYDDLWTCPECSYEWSALKASSATNKDIATSISTSEEDAADSSSENVVRDAFGNVLKDGDSVTIIKDLKVKGASSSIKVGTKVKNIRLQPFSSNGHDISCKIDGFGSMELKSEFVKKN